MREVRERALALARQSNAPALVIGERGSGRRMVARLIHEASTRRDGAGLIFDGRGLPATLILSELFGHIRRGFSGAYRDKLGLMWRAHGGSLILSDVHGLPTAVQIALDDFISTGEVTPIGSAEAIGIVDVRLLATTDVPFENSSGLGPFLQTFGWRLQSRLVVPPLRERPEDILELFDAFINGTHGDVPAPRLSPDAARLLMRYRWPGNISELRELATRLLRADIRATITADDIARELALNQLRDGRDLPSL